MNNPWTESTSIGAIPPPPGQVPNLDHPTDTGWRLPFIVWTVVPYFFTVAFCLVRAYVKVARCEIHSDDWLCIAAWIFVTAMLTSNVMTWIYGMGYYSWELRKETFINFNKWIYIGSALYIPGVFATKTAILILFSRIFSVNAYVARAIQCFIALLFFTLLPIECLKIGICRPVSMYWEMSASPDALAARCIDQSHLFKADITVAIITDLMILLIPIPLVFSLSFSLWKKIRILLSLATGGGAVGVALYKGILVFHPSPDFDPTKNFAILSILSLLEMNIGLICACFPSVALLLDKIRKKGPQGCSDTYFVRRQNDARAAGKKHQLYRYMRRHHMHHKGSLDPYSTTSWAITTFTTELAMLSGTRPEDVAAAGTSDGYGIGIDSQGRCVRLEHEPGDKLSGEGGLSRSPV